MNWSRALILTLIASPVIGMAIGRAIKYFSYPEREKRSIRAKRKQRRAALRILQKPIYDSRDSVRVFRKAMGR